MAQISCFIAGATITVAAIALAACGKVDSESDKYANNDIGCFPPEARPWIKLTDTAKASSQISSGPVSLYVDHSGSMAGFLRAQNENRAPFSDLIDSLPETASVESSSVHRFLFGKTLKELTPASATDLLKNDTYSCPTQAKDCDNQESRLDLALNTIAGESKQTLSFLISDLWMDDTTLLTSGAVALADPLRKILASGRSVAIYGVPAPYVGRIYDLPSHADHSINAQHPLFLLAIGPVDRLDQFHSHIERSPSRYLQEGIQSGSVRYSLFTLTPGGGDARSDAPFVKLNPRSGVTLSPAAMNPRRGLTIERLAVKEPGLKDDPAHPGQGVPATSWTGPSEAGVLPGAVWRGPITTKTLIWKLSSDKESGCDVNDWVPWGHYTGGWTTGSSADSATFELRPDEVTTNFGKPDVYLITGQVVRTSLDTPNPADAWMRQWSFGPEDEARVLASSSPMFPTLNLSDISRLLDNTLASAAEASPVTVGGFSVVVKLER